MTIPVKLAIAVIGGGSLAVGGYGTYELVRPKTIRDQLRWEGLDLADVSGTTDDGEEEGIWHKLYEKYSSETNKDRFKEGKEKTDVTIEDKGKLKEHCGKVFVYLKKDEENLKQSRNWCVRNSKKLVT